MHEPTDGPMLNILPSALIQLDSTATMTRSAPTRCRLLSCERNRKAQAALVTIKMRNGIVLVYRAWRCYEAACSSERGKDSGESEDERG